MRKTVIKVVSVVIVIVVSFLIGLQISNILINSKTEETEIENEEKETQKNNTTTNKTNGIIINHDIEATKRNSFVGVITEVDVAKKQIIVENPSHLVVAEIYKGDKEWINHHKIVIDENTYVKVGYLLYLDNVAMKEHNGNKIEIRDLKVGDTIKVSTRNIEYTNKLIFEPMISDHIVLIERKSKT